MLNSVTIIVCDSTNIINVSEFAMLISYCLGVILHWLTTIRSVQLESGVRSQHGVHTIQRA